MGRGTQRFSYKGTRYHCEVRLSWQGQGCGVFSSGPPWPGGPSALFQEAFWVLLGLNPTQGQSSTPVISVKLGDMAFFLWQIQGHAFIGFFA